VVVVSHAERTMTEDRAAADRHRQIDERSGGTSFMGRYLTSGCP
jgi:hypothetical protein